MTDGGWKAVMQGAVGENGSAGKAACGAVHMTSDGAEASVAG